MTKTLSEGERQQKEIKMTPNEIELLKLIDLLKQKLWGSTVCLLKNGTQFSTEAQELVLHCERKIKELFKR
jgi:acyl-CoA-binding protein